MSAGTYRIYIGDISGVTTPIWLIALNNTPAPPPNTNPELVSALNPLISGSTDLNTSIHTIFNTNPQPYPTTYSPVFAGVPSLIEDCILLSGQFVGPFSFASLPPGIIPISAVLVFIVTGALYSSSGAANTSFVRAIGTWDGSSLGTEFILNSGHAYTPNPDVISNPIDIGFDLFLVANPSILDLFSGISRVNFIFQDNGELGGGSGNSGYQHASITALYIEGEYNTAQSFQFMLITPTIRPNIGSTITVTSNPDDPTALLLDQLTEIDVQYYNTLGVLTTVIIPAAAFTYSSPYLLTFALPAIDTSPIIIILGVGNGTQFSGSTTLGELVTIFFTDGTGIYTLVKDKRNDTLYVQDLNPIQTIDVKIPDPFIKTGFLP